MKIFLWQSLKFFLKNFPKVFRNFQSFSDILLRISRLWINSYTILFGTRKNGPRKNFLRKLFSVKRMLGNLNDFFIFINWFHVCCRVLGFHRSIASQHSTHTHTHYDARRPPHDFSFLSFPGTIFPGIIFPGDHFSREPFFRDSFYSHHPERMRFLLWETLIFL